MTIEPAPTTTSMPEVDVGVAVNDDSDAAPPPLTKSRSSTLSLLSDKWKTLEDGTKSREVDKPFGWLVVLASWLIHFAVLGTMYSYGIYQRQYVIVFTDSSAATISFVGTLATGLFPLVGILAGRLADKLGMRIVVFMGCVFLVTGLILASFATEIWHLFLTQGVILGLGYSFCYFPAVSIVSQWFVKRRGVATGIAVSGSGIGGLVFGPLVQALIDQLGWQWSLRIVAFIDAGIVLIAIVLLFSRVGPSKTPAPFFYADLFHDARFICLFAGNFFATFGYMIPFYFTPTYATSIGLTATEGAIALGILNGASALGRLGLGFFADKMDRTNQFIITMFVAGLTLLMWPLVFNLAGLICFCISFGFFAGGYISLNPVIAADLFGVHRIAGVMGMLFSSSSLGNFLGPPIAGWIWAAAAPLFYPATLFGGFALVVTFLCMVSLKIIQIRQTRKAAREAGQPSADDAKAQDVELQPTKQDSEVTDSSNQDNEERKRSLSRTPSTESSA